MSKKNKLFNHFFFLFYNERIDLNSSFVKFDFDLWLEVQLPLLVITSDDKTLTFYITCLYFNGVFELIYVCIVFLGGAY